MPNLVVTRKAGERILIGGDIRVTICSVRGEKCRVAIEAPADVEVLREELLGNAEIAEPHSPQIAATTSPAASSQ